MESTIQQHKKTSSIYWGNKLRSGNVKPLMGSTFKKGNSDYSSITKFLTQEMLDSLEKISSGSAIKKFTLLFSTLATVIRKYNSEDIVTVATPVYKINEDSIVTGNVCFLQTELNDQLTVIDFLQQVQSEIRQTGSKLKYDVLGILHHYVFLDDHQTEALQHFGIQYDMIHAAEVPDFYPKILLQVSERNHTIELKLSFANEVFDDSQAIQFLNYFVNILKQITENKNLLLSKLKLMDGDEIENLIATYNKTTVQTHPERSIIQLFEKQVRKIPDRVAVHLEDSMITYGQLNEDINRLSNYIIDKYEISNHIVAIKLDRSIQQIITVFAVIKCGACYLPLDVSYPDDRVEYIIKDSGCKLFLTESKYMDTLGKTWHGPIENVYDIPWEKTSDPLVSIQAEQAIYCIYTSGSTGYPKGVIQTHQCLSNLIQWQINLDSFSDELTVLQTSSISFDSSILEFGLAFLSGGTLVLINENIRYNLTRMDHCIRKFRIEVFWMAASHLNIFMQVVDKLTNYQHVKHIISTAEQLKVGSGLNHFLIRHPNIWLHNFYGPSETHVITSHAIRAADGPVTSYQPIGKPISQSQVFILDKHFDPVPVGVVGEIYMSGKCLANGYVNMPDLTGTKFLTNPFFEGKKLYRSGDYGRIDKEGNLVFSGRKDDQVKLRGHRIELGEIESVILNHEVVREAIVVMKGKEYDEQFLGAYIEVGSGQVSVDDLIHILTKKLPDYMVPTYFELVDRLPLTPSGKLNRKLLEEKPVIENKDCSINYQGTDYHVKLLVRIWKEILGKSTIEITENFFQTGGNSLKAMKMLTLIYRELNIVLELKQVFEKPTIVQLSDLLKTTCRKNYTPILPIEEQDHYPLSYEQQSLWTIQQINPGLSAYNMPFAYSIEGPLEKTRIDQTITLLVEKNEILRSVYFQIEDLPRMKILPGINGTMVSQWRQDVDELNISILINEEFNRPFIMNNEPLFRIIIFKINEHKHILIFIVHHLIFDGWSMEVLKSDFWDIYHGLAKQDVILSSNQIQFKDYVAWQRHFLKSKEAEEYREFWLKQFVSGVQDFVIEPDYPRPASKTYNGNFLHRKLSKKTALFLTDLTHRKEVNLFTTVMATTILLLYRVSGKKDIVVGTTFARRDHPDLDNLIGFFVQVIPLKFSLTREITFDEFLSETDEMLLNAINQSNYPFKKLLNDLNYKRDPARSPLFNILIEYLDMEVFPHESEKGDLNIDNVQGAFPVSKYDLTFRYRKFEKDLVLELEYNTDLYSVSSANNLINYLVSIFEDLEGHSYNQIAEIGGNYDSEVFNETEEEKQKMDIFG